MKVLPNKVRAHASENSTDQCSLISSVYANDDNTLISIDWPMVQSVVEWFFRMAGSDTLSLRADTRQSERSDMVAKFNDENSDVQVFLTSYRTISLGMSLQNAGQYSSPITPLLHCCSSLMMPISNHLFNIPLKLNGFVKQLSFFYFACIRTTRIPIAYPDDPTPCGAGALRAD